MLTVNTVESNIGITNDIINSGKCINAINGSMLSELVNSSLPLLPDNGNELSVTVVANMIHAATYSDIDNSSLHTELVDKYTALLVNSVSSHIKVAKETILPIYKQATQEVIDYTNILNINDAMNDVNIIMFKKPLVADNNMLVDMLENYKGGNIIDTDFITIGSKSKEEILLLCTVGSNSLDNDILTHLANVDSNYITDSYNLFFNYMNSTLEHNAIRNLNSFEMFTKSLIGYLVARRLYDSVPDGLDMDLNSYRNLISGIRDYCGALLMSAIEGMENSMRSEVLILSVDGNSKTIKVNDIIYKKWLENNTEEAVLGVLVSDRIYSTMDMIQAKKEQLVEKWNNYKTYYTLRKEKDNIRSIKEFMLNLIYKSISENELTDIERQYMAINPNHVETVKKICGEYVDGLTGNDILDINQICLELVTKCRFYFTSSYEILNGMREVEKINPDINPREAALISIISYLTDFFIDQVKVENISGVTNGV
jgi:hypothetical protein